MYEVTGSSMSVHASLSKAARFIKQAPIPVVGKAIIKSISREGEMAKKTSIIYTICHRLRNDTHRENIKKPPRQSRTPNLPMQLRRTPCARSPYSLTLAFAFILTPVDSAGTSPGSRRCSSSSIHLLPVSGDL